MVLPSHELLTESQFPPKAPTCLAMHEVDLPLSSCKCCDHRRCVPCKEAGGCLPLPHSSYSALSLIYLFVCLFVFIFETSFLCVTVYRSWNSPCGPDWPKTHRDPPASASQLLGLKVCAPPLHILACALECNPCQTWSEVVWCYSTLSQHWGG